jgi:hypothetical protein
MTRFQEWVTEREPISRSLSMTLTLALALGCWGVVGTVTRWVLG